MRAAKWKNKQPNNVFGTQQINWAENWSLPSPPGKVDELGRRGSSTLWCISLGLTVWHTEREKLSAPLSRRLSPLMLLKLEIRCLRDIKASWALGFRKSQSLIHVWFSLCALMGVHIIYRKELSTPAAAAALRFIKADERARNGLRTHTPTRLLSSQSLFEANKC